MGRKKKLGKWQTTLKSLFIIIVNNRKSTVTQRTTMNMTNAVITRHSNDECTRWHRNLRNYMKSERRS